MNILHMKYAVEVARTGTINKASENLLIAQPNLSRSIKELESDLGITIFTRSSKGMGLTPEGEEFIGYARNILSQIDEMEKLYKAGHSVKQKFSISVPRASYISDAFAHFSRNITADPAEIFYMETNSLRAIQNVLHDDYKLGIIRYAEGYDKYFKQLLEEKKLSYELVAEFHYVLVMSRSCALAERKEIYLQDLCPMIEIAHADPFVPSISLASVRKSELPQDIQRRIFVFERGSQLELLSENPETFMWVSPLPNGLLERYGLVQRECTDNERVYRDVLLHRKDYEPTDLDRKFIAELHRSKQRYF